MGGYDMITLHLTRAGDTEDVYLRLPSSPAEIVVAFAELDAISTDTSTTEIIEAVSTVYNLSGYIKNTDVEKPGELEKLNKLARTLQSMDRDSSMKFEGVLDANSVNGIDDVLRLSESLEEYTLLPDAATGSLLGKYLVENDVVFFSERVRPYLDYQVIGAEFDAEHGGAFCRAGYVIRNDDLPQQFRQSACEGKQIMTLRLRPYWDRTPTPSTQTLALPATKAAMERVKQQLEIDDFGEVEITAVEYSSPYLLQLIPRDDICVEDANELATYIEQISKTDGELKKYLAVLSVEQPKTLLMALKLAIDLDDYECVPSDTDEYGRMALRRIGADDEIIDTIEGYMDFTKLGEDSMWEDGIRQTEFGFVRKLIEPFSETQQGMTMQ